MQIVLPYKIWSSFAWMPMLVAYFHTKSDSYTLKQKMKIWLKNYLVVDTLTVNLQSMFYPKMIILSKLAFKNTEIGQYAHNA